MLLSKLFVEFMVYSFIGWVYECIYCTCKEHHWQNRGFLFGPLCPIYGAGGMGGILLFGPGGLVERAHAMSGHPVQGDLPWWEIFLISALASIVLEYSTSYILEKIFHAVWWDYSDIPFNINGRVCLPATMGFGAAGVLIVRFLLPAARTVKAMCPPLLAELLSLILMAYLAGDLVLTISSLTQLLQKVEAFEEAFNARAEDVYRTAAELTYRQRYVLSSIRRMNSERTNVMLRRLKEALHHIKLGKAAPRQDQEIRNSSV